MLFDSHCHLTFSQLSDERAMVLENAKKNGVTRMMTIGCHPDDFASTIALAEKHKGIYAAIGLHPCDADADFSEVERYADCKAVKALGETGFDFYHEDAPPFTQQKKQFERHIALGKKIGKPIIVHLRKANAEATEFFQEHHDFPFLLHCFCGDITFARTILDAGGFIGIGGIATFQNCGEELIEAVKFLPLDRLLLETDAPFLAPVPHRGKRNEPAFVWHVAKRVAEIRGDDFRFLCEKTTENANRFFAVE